MIKKLRHKRIGALRHKKVSKRALFSFFTLLALLLSIFQAKSQYVNINDDATEMGGGCYELTPAARNQSGSVWSGELVNLNFPFTVSGRINFGTSSWFSAGADGIAFALQRTTNTSTGTGAGMGVAYIQPSLVVEFDTYQNGYDPGYDHIAINKHGDPDHNTGNNLGGPVQIINGSNEAQDGQWHDYKITWDPSTETITVDIDCQQRISWSGDVLQNIFNGDPNVYWGFSAATGNRFTYHQVCIDATNLLPIPDTAICQGETVAIDLPQTGNNYSLSSWAPTTGIINASAPSPTFSPTVTTEYVITYEGSCNEEQKDTFTIDVASAPTVDLGNDTSVCGAAQVTLDAGNPGNTYLWNTGATSQTINVGVGTYNVEVSNATGCIGRDTIVVSAAAGLNVDIGSDTSFCGAVNLNIDAGIAGATYLWNTGATSQSITASSTGTFYVDVDLNGCTASDTLIISSGSGPGVNLPSDFSLCAGTDSLITATSTASNILWNTSATSSSITAQPGQTYSVEAWNDPACVSRDTVVVSSAAALTVSLPSDTAICPGANLNISATPTGNLTWNDGSTGNSISVSTAGTYWVVKGQGSSCSVTDSIVVTLASIPTVDLGTDISSCSGTGINLDAGNAGLSFLWNTGATTQSVSTTGLGQYSVEVTDPASSCVGRDTVTVSAGNSLTVNLGNDTSLCVGSFNLDAGNAGANYLWNDGSSNQQLAVSTAGTYHVEVTDGSGCIGRDTIVVTSGSALTVDLGADSSICSGVINLDAGNPGSNYTWNDGSNNQQLAVSAAGTYHVEVTNGGGCVGRDTIIISSGSTPNVNLGSDSVFCGPISLTIDAGNPGANYLWSDGTSNRTLNITTAGNYFVQVTDAGGCIGRDTINITSNPSNISVDLGPDTSFCSPYSYTVNAGNPGASYLWNTGGSNQSINISAAGTYWVTVTSGSCQGSDTVVVGAGTPPNVDLGPDIAKCIGTDTTLNAGISNAQYLWSTGAITQSITVNSSNNYSVTVTVNGCSANDDINVTFDPLPTVNITTSKAFPCSGDTIVVSTGNGIDEHSWMDGSTGITYTTTTNQHVSVTVTNGTGCQQTDGIIVNFEEVSIDMDNVAYHCEGSSVTVGPNTVDPNLNYSWNTAPGDNGNGTLTTQTDGMHYLNAVSQNLCGVTDSIELFSITLPTLSISGDTAGCAGDLVQLSATSNGNITWWDGSTGSEFSAADSGWHVASSTSTSNGLNCTAVDSFLVRLYPYPETGEEIVVEHCFEFDPVLVIGTNIAAENIDWEHSNDVGNTATVYEEGNYTLFAYNYESCVSEQKFQINEVCPVRYFVPNSFTPDGDGLNDHFSLNVKNVVDYELNIFNRWGELVFQSNDPTESWNGLMNNQEVQQDVYIWRATFSGYDHEGRLVPRKAMGTVTVIR